MAKLIDMNLRKTALASNSEITFDINVLKLLQVIDKDTTIRQMVAKVDLPPNAFKESLKKLIKLRLVKLETAVPVSYVSETFLERTREVLIQLAGPLGEILLQETAELMNLDATKIPRDSVEDFVYNIAEQVPGEKQRDEFNTIMLEEIKMLGG